MRMLSFALAATLALGGCTTINAVTAGNVAIKNASESAQFKKVCRLRPIAVAGFDLLRSQVEISDAIVAKVYGFSAELKGLCDNPPTNMIAALKQGTEIYNRILDYQAGVATATAVKMGG